MRAGFPLDRDTWPRTLSGLEVLVREQREAYVMAIREIALMLDSEDRPDLAGRVRALYLPIAARAGRT